MAKAKIMMRLGRSANDRSEIEKTSEITLKEIPIAFLADDACKCHPETEGLDILATILHLTIPFLRLASKQKNSLIRRLGKTAT